MAPHNYVWDPVTTDAKKMQQVRDIHAKQVKEDKKITDLKEIPVKYTQLTNEYLTQVLAKGAPGVECTGFKLNDDDDGTTNRMHITNITWNEAGRKAGMPSSCFCKGLLSLNNRLQHSFSYGAAEVNFYNYIRKEVDFEAPEPYYAYADHESCGSIIFLVDLDGRVEWTKYKENISKENVKDMLLTMAKMHGKYWHAPVLDKFIPFSLGWHSYLLTCATEKACVDGWIASRDVVPKEMDQQKFDEIWPATCISYARNGERSDTLAHGDVHIGNWYLKDGRMGISDCQCMARGDWARDIAYLLGTACPVEKRRQWEDELLDYYLEQLAKHGGPKISVEEAWFELSIQSFTGLAYWTLTLTPDTETMPDMQPVDFTKEMIKRLAYLIWDRNMFEAIYKVKDQYQDILDFWKIKYPSTAGN